MLVRLQEWNSSCTSLMHKDFQNSQALPCPQMCPQSSGTLWFDCAPDFSTFAQPSTTGLNA